MLVLEHGVYLRLCSLLLCTSWRKRFNHPALINIHALCTVFYLWCSPYSTHLNRWPTREKFKYSYGCGCFSFNVGSFIRYIIFIRDQCHAVVNRIGHKCGGRDGKKNIQSRTNENTWVVLTMTISHRLQLRIVIACDNHMLFLGQYLNIDLNFEY